MFCDYNPHVVICRVVFSPSYLETSRWWQTQRAEHLKSCETPSPSDIKSTSVAFIPDKQSLKPPQKRYNPVEVRGDAFETDGHIEELYKLDPKHTKTVSDKLSITNIPCSRALPLRSSADLLQIKSQCNGQIRCDAHSPSLTLLLPPRFLSRAKHISFLVSLSMEKVSAL